MLHTMQRHKEILKDYKLEFNKIRNNFTARKDREDLLGSVRKEIEYVRLFVFHSIYCTDIVSMKIKSPVRFI